MKIALADKRIIEHYFTQYPCFKESLLQGRSHVLLGSKGCAKRAEITETDCKWLEVIERAIKKFEGTPKKNLIYKRFFLQEKEVRIFTDLYIDRSTYYLWQHEVYEYAYVVAVSKQLLTID